MLVPAAQAQKHRKRDTSKTTTTAAHDDDDADDADDGFAFERYFARDFPEARSAGLIRATGPEADDADDADAEDADAGDRFGPDYGGQRQVDRVLAEFATRDWSQCERKQRAGGLTCYVCHDDSDVRHEECMLVSGNGDDGAQPQGASHLSYTETTEYHQGADDDAKTKTKPKTKKKPTGADKKPSGAKSARLTLAAAADDGDEDDDDEGGSDANDATTPRTKSHRRTRKVIVQRRRLRQQPQPTDADVGEHQADASSGRRTIKRMTGDERSAHAAYAHTIRHHD